MVVNRGGEAASKKLARTDFKDAKRVFITVLFIICQKMLSTFVCRFPLLQPFLAP